MVGTFVSTIILSLHLRGWGFFCEDEGSNLFKCGADERRRRGLDRAAHLFLPFGAKMQIESLILCQKKASTLSVLFSTKSTLAGG